MADVTVEMVDVQNTLLREIATQELSRNSIALTYAFGLRSRENIDWAKVNAAIVERWSKAGLKYIKERAWKLHEGKIKP